MTSHTTGTRDEWLAAREVARSGEGAHPPRRRAEVNPSSFPRLALGATRNQRGRAVSSGVDGVEQHRRRDSRGDRAGPHAFRPGRNGRDQSMRAARARRPDHPAIRPASTVGIRSPSGDGAPGPLHDPAIRPGPNGRDQRVEVWLPGPPSATALRTRPPSRTAPHRRPIPHPAAISSRPPNRPPDTRRSRCRDSGAPGLRSGPAAAGPA